MNFRIDELKFDERGLIPAIVQDARTLEVLTLAYMNKESLDKTIETRETWFWSRSRNQLWHKGETSGNSQRLVELTLDCDQDAIVVFVEPAGPACHTGDRTCFHHGVESEAGTQSNDQRAASGIAPKIESSATENKEDAADLGGVLTQLYEVIETRKREPLHDSYTSYLFGEGLDKILKKVGEESAETIIAAKNDDRKSFISEASDLIYHLLVLLVARGVSLDEVGEELASRRNKRSGKRPNEH